MPAYVIADIEVLDPDGYEEYRQKVPATIAAHGGRYVVRGGQVEALEGSWIPRRCAVLEFPSLAQAREWWESPSYRQLRAIRERTARSSIFMVEGI